MTAYRRVQEVIAAAGIPAGPHACPKGLRHGFGVQAVSRGIALNMVQKWLGHAQLTTTSIYANAVGEEEQSIAARMWWRTRSKGLSLAPRHITCDASEAKHLRFPRASDRAAPLRPERHVAHSIASIRRQLVAALVRRLPRCPCCFRTQTHSKSYYLTQ